MISSGANISLSGLQAASRRLENSANNIANQQSTSSAVNDETVQQAFRPQDVVQLSNESGGVKTELRERNPATVAVYNPDNSAADANGIVQYPNVDTTREVIDQKFASYDFKANAKSLQAQNETLDTLLNIIA